MAFTVEDFQDLLRLLRERPDWQEQLRRHILTPDLLALPAVVQRLAEAQERAAEQIGALAAAQQRTEARLEALAARVDALVAVVERLTAQVQRHSDDIGELKGVGLEARLRENPAPFLAIVDEPEMIPPPTVVTWLQGLTRAGKLTRGELRQLSRADLFLRCRRDGTPGHLVVEISWSVRTDDIWRARDRATILDRAQPPAWPAVAGQQFAPGAAELAARHGVLVLDLSEEEREGE